MNRMSIGSKSIIVFGMHRSGTSMVARLLHELMVSANQAGYRVASFPIFEYIEHLVAGTRRMYGGQWSVGNKKPKAWNKKESYPI